jgi:L-rhamnose mutarotase
MHLNPGEAHEYRRRHDAMRPEIEALISDSGAGNCSICLDAGSFPASRKAASEK